MSFFVEELVLAGSLFIGMLLLFEVGRQFGVGRRKRDPQSAEKGSGPVETAVFGLLGLLLAFAFSGAATRFEARRHLITEEANAIGTAYLRIDLLPPESQAAIRQLFVRYLDTRVAIYQNAEDEAAMKAKTSETAELQSQLWSKTVAASQQSDAKAQAAMLLLPAMNAMIDITTTRAVAMQNHPPRVIFVLLAALSLLSALLAGNTMCGIAGRSWFYMILFAAPMSVTFYVILELEYPRYGLIRVDEADQVLIDLRALIR